MLWSQVNLNYEVNCGEYKGCTAVNICKLVDKTNSLTIHNSYCRDNIIEYYSIRNLNDKLDLHSLLTKLKALCHPTQLRVFCSIASKVQLKKWSSKKLSYAFNPLRPVGHNSISKWLKSLAKTCNFKNWESVSNHAGRQHGITKLLTHDELISPNAIIKQSRHSSFSGQKAYQRVDNMSQARIQRALAYTHIKATEIKATSVQEQKPCITETKNVGEKEKLNFVCEEDLSNNSPSAKA